MLGQRRGRWFSISPALSQRLVFDSLHDRKRWREMNGTHRLTDWADGGKATCPHLCTDGRHIILLVRSYRAYVTLAVRSWTQWCLNNNRSVHTTWCFAWYTTFSMWQKHRIGDTPWHRRIVVILLCTDTQSQIGHYLASSRNSQVICLSLNPYNDDICW